MWITIGGGEQGLVVDPEGVAGMEAAGFVAGFAADEAIAFELGDGVDDGSAVHAAACGDGFVGGPAVSVAVVGLVGQRQEYEFFEWFALEVDLPGD